MSDNLQRTEYNITEEKWSSFIVVAVLEVYLSCFELWIFVITSNTTRAIEHIPRPHICTDEIV